MKLKYILMAWLTVLCITGVRAAVVGQHTYASQSALAEGRWVKVSLNGTDDGIYQISYDQLSRMGFSNPERIGVYGFGGHELPQSLAEINVDDVPEVAIYHDQTNRRILFFGQGTTRWFYNASRGFVHRVNAHEKKAYYFVHEKADSASKEMATQPANVNAALSICDQYDVHFLHEENLINLGESGRELYGESFINNTVQTFDFENVAAGSVRVTANFVASAPEASSLKLELNGVELGKNTITKKSNEYAYATETNLDKTTTLEQATGLSVKLTYVPPTSSNPSIARLNYIRINASRTFSKPADFELFRSSKALNKRLTYSLKNALDDNIVVWDVTDPCNVALQETDDNGQFSATVNGIREYALVNLMSNNFGSVNNEGEIANQNLHALPMTNMVILTAPAYYDHACQLAEYRREHDNLHVTVLTPEQVYNEFSSGGQDVTAIRLLMKMFYDRYYGSVNATDSAQLSQRREPRYLLLWGDGYFDNLSIDRQYYLPCYETDASLVETSSCVCDDYFGFLDDDEGGTVDASLRYTIREPGLDIGIGRLPVNNLEQSANVLSKILRYGQNANLGTWKNKLCFLSDDDKEGDSYNCHVKHNDQLVSNLETSGHKEFIVQKIYLPAYKQTSSASGTDYPDAKKEFQETLKKGVLMVNYAGHGNTTAITNENMMTASAASALSMRNLPVWVTASCDVSRWDENGTSMGECLLLNPNGGGIALLSTVRVVYAQQNLLLNTAILHNIFNRFDDGTRYRLGDVLRASKLELGSDYNKLNFCLLGDPSLTLAYPEQQVEVTEINGKPCSATMDLAQLSTLSDVTVKGRVLRTGSHNETDTDFNGLIYPTFFDAVDTLTADKGYTQADAPTYTFDTRTKKAFAGRGEVKDGEFEFSFKVPLDISYRTQQGLANFYACSNNGDEASGFFEQYVLTGGDHQEITDHDGPEIKQLFLNNSAWSDGGVVNATPYFYAEVHDEGGFNATGNTVGHDIVLTIRCTSNLLLASQQHTLNDYFTTYTGDPTTGNVQYSIPDLEDGTYEATFRIWDVYNNPTTQKFTFTVQTQKAPEAVVVQAYPCPAKTGETITFRVLHNRPESAQEITLQVYTQTGYKVYETTVNSSAASKVYVRDTSKPTEIDDAINADESGNLMGAATIDWTSTTLRPGFYLYRVFMSSNGSAEMSESHLLMVNP